MDCIHGCRSTECVVCSPEEYCIMKCVMCSPGQTWHLVMGEKAICSKCKTERSSERQDEDFNIQSR